MKDNTPTIITIFGATGDLTKRKILPALAHLLEKDRLPEKIKLVGFSRQNLSQGDFRGRGGYSLASFAHGTLSHEVKDRFLTLLSYVQGDFEKKEDYRKLAEHLYAIDEKWGVCTNKLFYLAVPPGFYTTIFKNLHAAGLAEPCGDPNWTRVIVEKPFGKDLETAQNIDRVLGDIFKEEQIYRIDHYLGKEMVQNILAFRFSNNLFETIWHRDAIEKIEIKLNETIGIEDRGSFYDGIGALRDVGQNHLLQMYALMTMEHPGAFDAASIRKNRLSALTRLLPKVAHAQGDAPPRADGLPVQNTFRGQYKGYRESEGVQDDSDTETYFKITATAHEGPFAHTPIVLESGKCLAREEKEITVTLRHADLCLCPDGEEHYKNKITFRVSKPEGITIRFYAKKSGPGMDIEPREFRFNFHDEPADRQHAHLDEYERLLLDAVSGDQTLFVQTEEVEAMWRFVDPIIRAWEKNTIPLVPYEKGSRAEDIAHK